MRRFVLLLVLFGSAAAAEVQAAPLIKIYTASERAAIRAKPITQRPYRPGHIYGNTVRLIYSLTDVDITK